MKKILLIAATFLALGTTSSFAQDNARNEAPKGPRHVAMTKTEAMAKELGLNNEQKEVVMRINMRSAEQELRGEKISAEQKEQFQKQAEAQYRKVFTPEQFQKYQALNRRQQSEQENKGAIKKSADVKADAAR